VTPDVYTLSTVAQRRKWLAVLMEGRALRCHFPATARLPVARGYAYQTVAHNWLLRNALRPYDLIVNSNDFVGFLPTGVRRLHYFHFPVRASFAVMARYRRAAPGFVASPARWMVDHFDGELLPSDVVLANSRFTRDRVTQLWPNATVGVLYPPVDLPLPPLPPPAVRTIDVVTLGTIAPDKHQLEQIDIAAAMPKQRFVILGAVQSQAYARRVEAAVRTRGLTNVTLLFDATARRVSDIFSRSRAFLHMKEAEHFGISVAQAIAHGCVPVVHDSGGQVELVSDPALRFRSQADIPRVLHDVLAGVIPDAGYMNELRARVRDLAPECFRSRIKDALT
jgi:glycosyltransferase involved in cell wall biosynthesis